MLHCVNNQKVKINRIELHAANEVVNIWATLANGNLRKPYLALTLEFSLPHNLVLSRRQGLKPRYILPPTWGPENGNRRITHTLEWLISCLWAFRSPYSLLCGFFAEGFEGFPSLNETQFWDSCIFPMCRVHGTNLCIYCKVDSINKKWTNTMDR